LLSRKLHGLKYTSTMRGTKSWYIGEKVNLQQCYHKPEQLF
jgi:hypothetical protein